MEIVRSIATLKAKTKKGLIKLHNQTGTKIKGLYGGKSFVCTYIDDRGEGVSYTFEFKGAFYQVKYFDGCFCPYVVQVPEPKKVQN